MVKLRSKQADMMANGLILLVLGFLILIIQLRIIDHWLWMTYINTPSTFFFITGVISLWIKREKTFGYILTGISVIGYSNIAFEWSKELTLYAFPIVVMVAGITVVFYAKFK